MVRVLKMVMGEVVPRLVFVGGVGVSGGGVTQGGLHRLPFRIHRLGSLCSRPVGEGEAGVRWGGGGKEKREKTGN